MAEPEEAQLQGPVLCLHASPPLHDVGVQGSAGQCAPEAPACGGGRPCSGQLSREEQRLKGAGFQLGRGWSLPQGPQGPVASEGGHSGPG